MFKVADLEYKMEVVMHSRVFVRLLVAVLITLFTVDITFGQPNESSIREHQLLDTQLQNGRIRAQGISNFFSVIALRFDIPIGVEVAADDDQTTWYNVELKGEKLGEFLVRFALEHSQYSWQVQDGVINVIPTINHDLIINELLDTKVSSFVIAEQTGAFTFANELMQTPEISRIMTSHQLKASGLNFSGVFFPQLGRKFGRKFEQNTMKFILNAVIRESPIAKMWTIKRFEDQRLSIRVDARAEANETQSTAP